MKVGFGTYRISDRSKAHYEALKYALESGVEIIDTSSTYTDGESEKLIGNVLKDLKTFKYFIISKVGYIQGHNLKYLAELNEKGLAKDDLVVISEDLKHSIHPEFIQDQIEKSLERLQMDSIDCYLLHNPEYYLKTENSTKKEYYSRIEKAFVFLEQLVKEDKIKSYGISSNTFVDPKQDHLSTDLDKVMALAKDIAGDKHNFKYIQFPLNLMELGALERQYDGDHLIERAAHYGLKTIINRPLNAIVEHGLVRLANYEVDPQLSSEFAEKEFIKCMTPLIEIFNKEKEFDDESLFDIPLVKQISDLWYKQNSPDGVDQIFFTHFFPLVAKLHGRDLSPEESQRYYQLYDYAVGFARKKMNERAESFKQQAIDKGLLFESDKNLCQMALEKYATLGVDITLVGMRKNSYVDDFKEFF